MKKRRALLSTLLGLLLVVGIPAGLLIHEYHPEQASHNLIAAIEAENTPDALAAVRAGADPNFREALSNAPTLSASERLLKLIDRLLHPDAQSDLDKRLPPLLFHLYVSGKGDLALINALLDAGANINAAEGDGTSTLHWACYYYNIEVVQALLNHHANPNLRAKHGRTPLDWASEESSTPIIEMLRKAGAKTSDELDAEEKR